MVSVSTMLREEKRWSETVKPQGLSSVRDVYAHAEGSKDGDIVSV